MFSFSLSSSNVRYVFSQIIWRLSKNSYIKKCIKLVCFDVLKVKGENVMKWVLGF